MAEVTRHHACDAVPAGMLSVEEARRRLLGSVPAADRAGEDLDLTEALGRVLARPVSAPRPVPAWANSAMDGYALRAGDLSGAVPELPVVQRIPAGVSPDALPPGTAARIFTGAPVPEGADTVVVQEDCREGGGRVRIHSLPRPGANIRPAGEDLAEGEEVLPAGRLLGPGDLALAAAAGSGSVRVRQPLRVAVLVTGDELIPPGRAPGPGQICDSNGPLLQTLLTRIGCEPHPAGRLSDDPHGTREALTLAAGEADLIVTSGGVSVGEEDHVRAAIENLGTLELWRVAIKPGKPLAFGRIADTPLLGLPGNPASLFVTFALFGAPLIRRLQTRDRVLPAPLSVPAAFRRPASGKREEYLRVRPEGGRLVPYPHQGSGVLSGIAWTDGLARVPAGTPVADGDLLDYYSVADLLA